MCLRFPFINPQLLMKKDTVCYIKCKCNELYNGATAITGKCHHCRVIVSTVAYS